MWTKSWLDCIVFNCIFVLPAMCIVKSYVLIWKGFEGHKVYLLNVKYCYGKIQMALHSYICSIFFIIILYSLCNAFVVFFAFSAITIIKLLISLWRCSMNNMSAKKYWCEIWDFATHALFSPMTYTHIHIYIYTFS